jgi:hypothetical protein
MLNQDEFAAMLQRYAAGRSMAAEQRLVDHWLAQPAEPSQPELTQEELTQVRAAMWQRIQEATLEN